MCGIFCAFSSDPATIDEISGRQSEIVRTIELRGPDRTSVVRDAGFLAIHTLLSMTGWYREQPVVNDDFVMLFNGEIYNDCARYSPGYGDTDFLVGQIRERGRDAFALLDGEFAICLYSPKLHSLMLATDPFGTKPLYYQLGPNYCVAGTFGNTVAASGRSAPIHQVPANSLIEIDLRDCSVKRVLTLRQFDFHSQTIDSFERWNLAFTGAIRKRASSSRHKIFVSFSAGHDSGLIAAELIASHIPFHIYAIPYLENQAVLDQRIALLEAAGIACDVLTPSADQLLAMRAFLRERVEPFQLINTESSFRNFADPDMRNLSGYIASGIIHEKARRDGNLIHLCGQGADEVIADYFNENANTAMSDLKGRWEDMTGPWPNFNAGWNRVFLGGGERIAGAFGIETRYPFLDVDVVQEYLYLHPDTKRECYKAPVTNRLRELGFPYHMRKQGFAGFNVAEAEAEVAKRSAVS